MAAAVLTATVAFSQNATLPKTSLKVGDMAPDFAISADNTSNHAAVKLSDFRGKKSVILAFFPAAFTGG
jgi:peroxiredoxin